MKYHPNYPSSSKPPEKVDQETLDKWKKDKTEAMSVAYRLSRRLGQRDKDHAQHYRTLPSKCVALVVNIFLFFKYCLIFLLAALVL